MITLFRWFILQYKKVKVQLALYQFADKAMKEFVKNPKEIENKIFDALIKIVQSSDVTNK